MVEKQMVDTLLWKLKQRAEEVDKEVAEAIDGIGYKILEQVRLGNKDNVFYLLLRCFKAKNKKFPEELIDVFKPEYDGYFKTLIFSFLAPILGEKQG